MRPIGGFLAALALLAPTPGAAQASRDVQVGLYRHAPPAAVEVRAAGAFEARSGSSRLRLEPGQAVTLRAQSGRVTAVLAGRTVLMGPELALQARGPWRLHPSNTAPRRYEGTLRVRAERGRLRLVLGQDLEAYVRACAGDEMPPDWPIAALEAQAIASRTYAAANRGRHAADGFDYCDLTHCQRYRGLAGADSRVAGAVSATAGRVLQLRGRPATVLWHAACGSWRAPNEVVFGGAAQSQLRGGFDGPAGGAAWCREAPQTTWAFEADAARVAGALRTAGLLAPDEPLASLSVSHRTEGGYAATVRLEGRYARALTGYGLWTALGPHFGWGDLKSPAFGIRRVGNRYRFEGRGLGHGVGMCQWGARGQALAGQKAAAILAFYFPGTSLR
ncbi:MAG: SpoIID/LytB domain-containing protein [Candidatus Sericytochromatia bacterium]